MAKSDPAGILKAKPNERVSFPSNDGGEWVVEVSKEGILTIKAGGNSGRSQIGIAPSCANVIEVYRQ
jgi:hypothetical protein